MKISIITVVFNAASTILEALDSILNQTHSDIELIVIDGASTDGTRELLESHREKLSVLISEPDDGIYHALNKGIARASGDVIGFLHADDVLADDHVLHRVARCFEDPDVKACFGDLVYVSSRNSARVVRYWRAGHYSAERVRRGWMPPHPTLYARCSLYRKLGGFDTRYRIAADYECMLRLFSNGDGRVLYIPEVLVRMRLGGASNRSFRNVLLKSWEDYRALRENQVGGLGALAWKNLSKLGQFVRRE